MIDDPTEQPLGGHTAALFRVVRRFIWDLRSEPNPNHDQWCLEMQTALENAACGFTWTDAIGRKHVCVFHPGHRFPHEDMNALQPSQEQFDTGVERDPSHFDVWTHI